MSEDAYGRLARLQDLVMEPLNGPLRDIGFRMFPVTEDARVLDVGCGTGAQLQRYAAAGCRVSGIDLSPAMLARARARLGDDVDLRQADAAHLPYDDESFDLVVATLVLHEIPALTRDVAAKQMLRVLAPSGRLLVTDFHPGPWAFPRGTVFRAVSFVAETVARHRDRSQQFLRAGGVPGLAARIGAAVEVTKVVAGGNMGLYLIAP